MVEKQFQTYMFSFFLQKVSIFSEDLIAIASGFQMVGAATEKAQLLIFNLVLGTKRCLEAGNKGTRVIREM